MEVRGRNSWQSTEQQRLSHLANNQTSNDFIPILLPSPKGNGKYVYENVPAKEAEKFIRLDVGLSNISGCQTKKDCQQETMELGVKPMIENPQATYRYIYDMDSLSASRDFIPFLQSSALPLRSSIFRSWYDSRLTPWLHFVPQDGRLHGLHSTLAYFMGIDGMVNGRKIEAVGRSGEAQFIADQGKRWSEQVLRKGDAEVYLFRLLLEWGRIVDDRRDELGYIAALESN